MSSSAKTSNYQLNQWTATDRPKRTDFNADNLAVDNALASLSTPHVFHGYYIGNGASSQVVTVNGAQSLHYVRAFRMGRGVSWDADGKHTQHTAEAVASVAALGISLTSGGFTVSEHPGTETEAAVSLNRAGTVYGYIALVKTR